MQVQWSHVVLKVRELEPMVSFYCDTLGFEVADRGQVGDRQIVFLSGSSSDHHQLALMTGRCDGAGSNLDHSAFRVGSIDDVREMIGRVAADDRVGDGAAVTHGNAVSVYFADPEGNGIEVFCDTPWHVPQPQIAAWDPSQPTADVLAGVDAAFADVDGRTAMDEYRADRAAHFGEVSGP